jgi:UDP-glucuronate 4-epimerase
MTKSPKNVLVTGGAGFIGSHLCERLINENYHVVVIDNFDTFYSPALKENNISRIINHPQFTLFKRDILDILDIDKLINQDFDIIIHLASKAGVRDSITESEIYEKVNIEGTKKVLEFARIKNIQQIIFASSSSVYGNNPYLPWNEDLENLNPLSPYAKYKLECETIGKIFAEKNHINFTALRLFSVYGPRMRPDLAIAKFTEKIINGKPIHLFGNGDTNRDYTYIDDIINGFIAAISYNFHGFHIFNLGTGKQTSLINIVSGLENSLNKNAVIEFRDVIPEESKNTLANNKKAKTLLHWVPQTEIFTGINYYTNWNKTLG